MPGKDGTGPWGAGPMTGRGAGYCAVYLESAILPSRGYGRGLRINWGRGRGRGWGRGLCRDYPPAEIFPSANSQANSPITQTAEQEIAALENYQKTLVAEKADLEQELEGAKARIEDLKKKQQSGSK